MLTFVRASLQHALFSNAITKVGYHIVDAHTAEDILNAEKLVFPGVGEFGQAVDNLKQRGLWDALQAYLASGRPFFGICVGFQVLFEGSEESEGVPGLGFFKGKLAKFRATSASQRLSVPHIGWNGLRLTQDSAILNDYDCMRDKVYFVHSFRVLPDAKNASDVVAVTDYCNTPPFVAAVRRGNVYGTQFHPEKSGRTGLRVLLNFLSGAAPRPRQLGGFQPGAFSGLAGAARDYGITVDQPSVETALRRCGLGQTQLAKRIVVCLDVRSNDQGDLVLTKGLQYDVREKAPQTTETSSGKVKGQVRNFGQPAVRVTVELKCSP